MLLSFIVDALSTSSKSQQGCLSQFSTVVMSPFNSTRHVFLKDCVRVGVLIPAEVLITNEVRVTQACCGLGA